MFNEVTWTEDVATGGFQLPVTMPATVVAGDILLAAVAGPGHEPSPAGWAAQAYSAVNDLTLYQKIADGTEGGTVVLFGDNSIPAGQGFLAGVARYTFVTAYASIDTKTFADELYDFVLDPFVFYGAAVGDLAAVFQVKGYFVMKQGATSYTFAGSLATDRGSVTGIVAPGVGNKTLMLFDYEELTGDQTAESPVATVTFNASAGTPSPAVSYRYRDAASLEPVPITEPEGEGPAFRATPHRVRITELPYQITSEMRRRTSGTS